VNQRNHNNERWSGDNGVDPEDPDQGYFVSCSSATVFEVPYHRQVLLDIMHQ